MGDEAARKEEGDARGRGRPSNVTRIGRERSGSEGDIVEFLANKRKALAMEGKETGKATQEGEAFKKSKLVRRSPERQMGCEDMMVRITEELEEVVRREVGRVERRMEEMTRGWEKRVEEIVGEARKEREEMVRKWEAEREEMSDRIAELEKKVEDMAVGGKEKGGEGGGKGEQDGKDKAEEVEREIREVELRLDRGEREKRRKNVIVKGVKRGEGHWGGEIKRLWSKMGVLGKIVEMQAIGGVDKEGRGMVLVELEGRDERTEVMMAKGRLKGEREWVEADLTQMERRVKWRIEREADMARRKGRRVKVGYMKMWVDNRLKWWDEATDGWKTGPGDESGRRRRRGDSRGARGKRSQERV